jgi:hypothetical protein
MEPIDYTKRMKYERAYYGNGEFIKDHGVWYLSGEIDCDNNFNEEQDPALNAELKQWIEALPEEERSELEKSLV